MQVVGTSLVIEAVRSVARRAVREDVRAWAERVIFRHIKRTPALMARVDTERKLEQVLSAEKLPVDAVDRIRSAFAAGEEFFAPSAPLVTRFLTRASDTMDFVCSLPETDRRVRRIERMGWTDAEAMSEAWHAALARSGARSRNLIAGTTRILEFDGGVHVSELQTAKALKAEGSAMGHCVGGYWLRVLSGETRIVSIRDGNGHPHVTIELGHPARLLLPDGGMASMEREPGRGRDEVCEVRGEWMAVQVRGKQNNPPVEKWQGYLERYLAETGMLWSEWGRRLGGQVTGRTFVTYRVGDIVGLDPDAVAELAEDAIVRSASSSREAFGDLYRKSGLEEVHAECLDRARLEKTAEVFLPLAMQSIARLMDRGVPFARAVARSALVPVLGLLSPSNRSAVAARRRVLDLAVEVDAQEAAVVSRVLVRMPGQKAIVHHRHEIPLLSVALLSLGLLNGMEDEVAEMIRPSLASALSHVRSNPGDVHTVVAAVGGLDGRDIIQACHLCGLSLEYGAAVKEVESGVRSRVKDLRLAAKRERVRPSADIPSLNLLGNLLSDGYEDRLRDMVRSGSRGGLLFAPSKVIVRPERAFASMEPPIKKYRIPGR
ncbi:hypothetical protein G6L37_00690 [Agrobacterium rubi]|nr:hypothetical protein [Agrobacterium rubi]NTF23907.1 hypothetical protein [Agrobacterium rubi]